MSFRNVALSVLVIFSFCFAEISDGWKFNLSDASNPLMFVAGDKQLNMLDGVGPVFDLGNNDIVTSADYDVEIKDVVKKDNGVTFICNALIDDLEFEYTLDFTKLADNAMEFCVSGPDNVSSFLTGNVTGSDEEFKQFNTGERDLEAHQGNSSFPAVLYWPSQKMYILCQYDPDNSNAAKPSHRKPSRRAFALKQPPLTIDTNYALLTDGSRVPLKERFVIRFSKKLWDVYGEVPNEPSEYRQMLSEMVFFDGWTEKFCYGTEMLEFLKKAVPDKVKFYTIIQHWAAWKGWDSTNPDAYRIPDHTVPWANYGTEQDLKKYIALADSMGNVGLRCNYLHVNDGSWSYQEGVIKRAKRSSGEDSWFSDLNTTEPMVIRQENDIKKAFDTDAALHDQWGSVGTGYPIVNCDAEVDNAGKISAVREMLRGICEKTKNIHKGPLSSESLISEFLIGKYLDTGDYCIFGANQRYDFSPEYKLRRLHQLTTTHAMGLGYRHYYRGNWAENKEPGQDKYFKSDIDLDSYRACEVLYGNGGYLYVKKFMRKIHALTECMTVGIAQRYYTLQPIDYVKYSNGGRWTTIERIIPRVNSAAELHEYYKRFHVRYANGCNVWVNRDDAPLEIRTPDNQIINLDTNCWLVYTEDGDLLVYTAVVSDPVVAGYSDRVDYCESKSLNIKYVNPRKIQSYKGASKPTVWVDGKVHFVLNDSEITAMEMCQ